MQLYQTQSTIKRVSRDAPCVFCGKVKGCYTTSNGLAGCYRIEQGSIGRDKQGLFLHRTGAAGKATNKITAFVQANPTRRDLELMNKNFQTAINPIRLRQFAAGLGVSESSLIALGIGRDVERNTWSFPMHDADGRVIGLRLRTDAGKKFAVIGGREGIFIPRRSEPGPTIFITEGPTDAAAIFDLNLFAIGRPSCTGATTTIKKFIAALKPRQVAIAADADEPGRRGAAGLAIQLAAIVADVRVIVPPGGLKDFRDAKRAGMNADDLADLVDRAEPVRLAIDCEVIGG